MPVECKVESGAGKFVFSLAPFPLSILLACFGYFIYGKTIEAFLAVLDYCLLLSITSLVCLVPFVGVIIYALYLIPWVTSITTSLTGITLQSAAQFYHLILGIYMLLGTIMTAISSKLLLDQLR